MLPYAQSIVVVLLKLLLATVTGNSVNPNPPGGPGSPTEEKPITGELPYPSRITLCSMLTYSGFISHRTTCREANVSGRGRRRSASGNHFQSSICDLAPFVEMVQSIASVRFWIAAATAKLKLASYLTRCSQVPAPLNAPHRFELLAAGSQDVRAARTPHSHTKQTRKGG